MSETICQTAHRIVTTDRGNDYGHPYDNFQATATLWSPILGFDITPEQVALCMIQLKIARLVHSITQDTIVDIAGYAQTLDMVRQERVRREAREPLT